MINRFLEFYNRNEEYRTRNNALLDKIQKEYWSNEKNKEKQSLQTTEFYEKHPEQKKLLSI